tara:strand:- start:9869 stop:10573 length:705 start_codon:yes stop_codon:yes gene_type:complete
MKKIIFTGGSGKFGKIFKKFNLNKKNIYYPSSITFDITNPKKMEKFIKKIKPKFIIHAAAISRPMDLHEKNIQKSVSINIIGTSNIVNLCQKYRIKLIYFSTNYVYPSKKGNYKEHHPLLPFNNYAWSKLGGECATQMLKNSLILRICMTQKPFLYNSAYTNLKTNFMFHEDLAKVFFKLINKRGIINVGGPTQSIYNFAKTNNRKIKKKILKKTKKSLPLNSTMNIGKFKRLS